MFTKLLLSILLIFFLLSCGDSENEVVTNIDKIEASIPEEDPFDYDTLQGMYIGDFGGSDIRVILNYVSSKNAIGYNIHKGLQRNITGKVTRSGDSIQLVLQEPGDNEFDGVFTLLFTGDKSKLTGFWESNSGKIPKRSFKLKKVIYVEAKDEKDINMSNFADYYSYLSDTIGHYSFKDDGLCLFEYYPVTDYENYVEQLVEVRGSWSLKGQVVTVNWQPNKIFPSRKSEFTIFRSEWGDFTLKSGDEELYNYRYGP
ncbi:MAG: hypothetical protein A3D92_21560 [Bacteroidetes bacterium RIFCSPHIGHO2_02_FULL_44_7]|nr:MAG: hypothetical protein A3D92_21560 [Bacteroidetes bacterium RIFCSPHIGHO2_02_FULL_44_7]